MSDTPREVLKRLDGIERSHCLNAGPNDHWPYDVIAWLCKALRAALRETPA